MKKETTFLNFLPIFLEYLLDLPLIVSHFFFLLERYREDSGEGGGVCTLFASCFLFFFLAFRFCICKYMQLVQHKFFLIEIKLRYRLCLHTNCDNPSPNLHEHH